MTAEKFTEELLHQSHSLGIKEDVMELASTLRKENSKLNFHTSLETAFSKLTK